MVATAEPSLHRRYKPRSSPLAGVDLRTAEGRRVRDIALGLLTQAGADTSDSLATERAVFAAKARVRADKLMSDPKTSPQSLAALMTAVDMAERRVGAAA